MHAHALRPFTAGLPLSYIMCSATEEYQLTGTDKHRLTVPCTLVPKQQTVETVNSLQQKPNNCQLFGPTWRPDRLPNRLRAHNTGAAAAHLGADIFKADGVAHFVPKA